MTIPPETVTDRNCIHCRQTLIPCTCRRDRGCEHNGWKHARTGEHRCPGMPTKAYPASGDDSADLVEVFRQGAGAWYRDAFSDIAVKRGVDAVAPLLRADGAAAERDRIRQLAEEHDRQCNHYRFPFADLLRAEP